MKQERIARAVLEAGERTSFPRPLSDDAIRDGFALYENVAFVVLAANEAETLARAVIELAGEKEKWRAMMVEAMYGWGSGPPTMKQTADWANRWVPYFAAALSRTTEVQP